MNELAGLQAFRDRFITGYLIKESIAEFLPVIGAFLPASQRTQTAEGQSVWRTYVATEGGAMHARCLAQREADPNAVPTPEQARVIVRPWLDPAHAAPVLSGPRIARYWFTLPHADADKGAMLRFFIAAAAEEPVFHEVVRGIVIGLLLAREPLCDELIVWTAGALTGKRPAAPPGRSKNTMRDRSIFVAVLVLRELGLRPTLDDGKDRELSGCGIVAGVLDLSYNAVATVWTDQRRNLKAAGLLA